MNHHHLVLSGNDDHYLPAIEVPVRGSNIEFRLDARYEVSSVDDDDDDKGEEDDDDEPLTSSLTIGVRSFGETGRIRPSDIS